MALLTITPLRSRVGKGEILDFIVSPGGLERKRVGRIELQGRGALVEVPDDHALRLARALDGATLNSRRVSVYLTRGGGREADGDHFSRLLHLLALESEAEQQQALERVQRRSPADAEATGQALANLVLRDEYSGLGGRCIVTLSRRNPNERLPWTRLQVGSPVLLTVQSAPGEGQRGVVCEREQTYLRVALDEPPELDGDVLRLDLSADETSTLRMRSALEQARAAKNDRLAELRAILLGELPSVSVPVQGELPSVSVPVDGEPAGLRPAARLELLNESQREAVRFCLDSPDVAVIHGPPGTGKTTTVVELIRQTVQRGERVLVTAPSNLAVDNLLEKLLLVGELPVRLGHPARVLPELRARSLDLLVEAHPDARQARKLAKEAFSLFRQASKWTRGKPDAGMRRDLRQEARAMLNDARKLESDAVERVLNQAHIVCSTLTGLDPVMLGKRSFDLAVIDEACQATEPAAWIPLLRCGRIVLAGDHCQLPPTVLSVDAQRAGFGVSLLERLVDLHGPSITRRLDVQYRMHEAIVAFSSDEFYDGTLQADESVRTHLLADLPGIQRHELTETPVTVIDTAGAGYDEEPEPDGESRLNPSEARLAARKVKALLEQGLTPAQIGVIAPYSAQVRRLREMLPIEGLEIDSVDGFQGREKECIVVSLVRSNPEGTIGFLADVRRTNVALTRARRKLIVIGDSATLAYDPFYQRLFEHFERTGAYHTVWEEAEGD